MKIFYKAFHRMGKFQLSSDPETNELAARGIPLRSLPSSSLNIYFIIHSK